jgi:D-tyrosyl-tRNA(Tyr) deacylase
MKIVLQRVKQAAVEVNKQTVGQISKGVCLLIGVEKGDTEEEAQYLAQKITELRIFPDQEGKMNLSLLDIPGEVLAVSQFTLAASLKKGRRPSFDSAEEPEKAENLFRFFVDMIKEKGIRVETGVFGALMDIHLINDGPVTFILERKKLP